MKSASDRAFKLSLMLNVLDWLTFNFIITIFVLAVLPLLWKDYAVHLSNFVIANLSYITGLQIVTISLHHRHSMPADVLNNTSRTSLIFIFVYTSLLGMLNLKVPDLGHSMLITLFVFIATTAERLVMRSVVMKERNENDKNRVKTIILGSGNMAQRVVDVMTNSWNGYKLEGYFAQPGESRLVDRVNHREVEYLGSKNDILEYVNTHDIDEVYIEMKPERENEFKQLMLLCDSKMIRTYYIPTTAFKEFRKARVVEMDNIYVMSRRYEPLRNIRNRIKKRAFDLLVSTIFLCTVFPFVLVIVAIISKTTMPGPLFFKQKRTGYDGKDFYCYKFRSMRVNKDSDKVQAVKDDPRVTRWGAFMRHTNIDELPQFINVFKGDMSLVGPRPHMLAHTEYYSNLISNYMIRHYVKPGITGWAQTHGERGETQTVQDMKRRVEKDIWYIEHWSLWLDIQIMFKTVYDVIHGDKKAY